MKTITQYICQNCGSSSRKWAGRCDACNEWNTMQEEISEFSSAKQAKNLNAKKLDFLKLNDEIKENIRINTGINELDRVLGGGLVESSAILIGGDPGIGKSTLLLQLSSSLSLNGMKTAYVTGEESTQQVNLRAKRLKAENSPVNLLAATNIHEIITSIKKLGDVNVVIIDSIQTMFAPEFSSAPGTVSQVRACAHELIKFAKNNQTAIILVGHVTKDGQIAGPKVLEHMVDTVLYFEGDRNNYFRILRSVKNRFGGINEIGVFEMGSLGLLEVTNPSA